MQFEAAIGEITQGWSPRWRRSPLERGQLAVLLALAVLTAGAWALTLRMSRAMTEPMAADAVAVATGAHPGLHLHHMGGIAMHDAGEIAVLGLSGVTWSLTGFAVFVVAWAVMMAAMMFPGVAPMLLLVHSVARHRERSGSGAMPTSVFAAGYLLVWTVVGAITWVLAHAASQLANRMGATERAASAPLALGIVLMLAGLYQLSPFKQLCLDHCRSPVVWVIQRWRPGPTGALRMGVGHGLYCLGCCLALFAVLVATGVMSLAWMLMLTLIDFAEKVLPVGRLTARASGAAFVLLGILVATGRFSLPWLG